MKQEPIPFFEDKFLDLGDQGVLRYCQAGSRTCPSLLLLHGIGSAIESWYAQFKFLSNHFFVTAMDIPGFGKSRINNNSYETNTIINLIDTLVQKLELGNISLVGHSLGGFLSLEYSNVYPLKTNKLALIAPAGFGMPSKRFRFLGSKFSQLFFLPFVKTKLLGSKIFRYFYGNGLPLVACEKLSQYWEDSLVATSFVKVLHKSNEHKSVNASLILSPSLVIWGKKDWVLNYHQGFLAASRLPNAKLKLFDQFGHGIHAEIPENINLLILEFLTTDNYEK